MRVLSNLCEWKHYLILHLMRNERKKRVIYSSEIKKHEENSLSMTNQGSNILESIPNLHIFFQPLVTRLLLVRRLLDLAPIIDELKSFLAKKVQVTFPG